jgi:hypothetical protein
MEILMKRITKRRFAKDLRKIPRNSPKYWKEVLRREKLTMDAGRDPGHRKLVYVGDSAGIEAIHEMQVGKTGRTKMPGAGPDVYDRVEVQ